jgi:hypothetical protein
MNAPEMARGGQDSKVVGSLYVAFELGDRSWKLALGFVREVGGAGGADAIRLF